MTTVTEADRSNAIAAHTTLISSLPEDSSELREYLGRHIEWLMAVDLSEIISPGELEAWSDPLFRSLMAGSG